jgi:dienelactone hydrolase
LNASSNLAKRFWMPWRFGVKFRELLKLAQPSVVQARTLTTTACDGFSRELITYDGDDGRQIPAFRFVPVGSDSVGGVVVFHQHAGEFHLGKSEVAGLAGSPLQAFGPALARRGLMVLAPDAETFEDRRAQTQGIEPHEKDWQQHYNGMAYRLIHGDVIMRKHMDDAQRAVSVLLAHPRVAPGKVGISGHSFGGTVSLYLGAVDERCRFVCSSGAARSFASRAASGTGIGMIEIIPDLANRYDIADVIGAIPPRDLLLVSATDDEYSADTDQMLDQAGLAGAVEHIRADGGHELDTARFEAIVDWLVSHAATAT